jgi:hypothetical protein
MYLESDFCYCFRLRFVEIRRKKKVREFPVPSRDVTTKLSLGGNNDVINELFLPRGCFLVSDIPAGDGKLVNLFYGVDSILCRSAYSPCTAKKLLAYSR